MDSFGGYWGFIFIINGKLEMKCYCGSNPEVNDRTSFSKESIIRKIYRKYFKNNYFPVF